MAGPPNIRLDLSNKAENVVLVRETLTGLSEAIGFGGGDLNDIRTAVTEACNNVVMHAYEGEEGPLEVEIYAGEEALEVVVRDRGAGLQPQERTDEWVVGIGLPVIRALVHRVRFLDTEGGGTEVRMEFATPIARPLESPREEGYEPPSVPMGELSNTTTVTMAPVGPLARTVLPRLLAVLAARAHFRTDRISDALLVADALGAHAPSSITDGHLSVAVSVQPRTLEMRLGPLRTGHGQRLVSESAVDGVGRVIEQLTDDQLVAPSGGHEVLNLRLVDPR
jgi:anti-sigma regulatory factor (Ser/Thr protein kinase)